MKFDGEEKITLGINLFSIKNNNNSLLKFVQPKKAKDILSINIYPSFKI